MRLTLVLVYGMDAGVQKNLESEFIGSSDLLKINGVDDVVEKEILRFHFPEVMPVGSSFKSQERFLELLEESIEDQSSIVEALKEKSAPHKKSNAYYRVDNHHELHQLGASFDSDIDAGKRVFSFATVAAGTCLSRTVLGIAAHIEYHRDQKIIIVTKRKEFFESYFADSDFVTISEYCPKLFEGNEIVLWEMPRTPNILKGIDSLYPSLEKIDSCSIVVATDITTYKDIDKVSSFYAKYNIGIKGLIVDKGNFES